MSDDIKLMPAEHYAELQGLSRNYWWHCTRRNLVLRWSRIFLGKKTKTSSTKFSPKLSQKFSTIIDLGCGVGQGLLDLEKDLRNAGLSDENAGLYGVDHESTTPLVISEMKNRFFSADLDAGVLPIPVLASTGPRLWVCMDVLEHLDHPEKLILTLKKTLGREDLLVITVPAFAKLWSGWDVKLGHKRRYRLPELRSIFKKSGFHELGSGYLFSWAFVPALFRAKNEVTGTEFPKVSPVVNSVLKWIGRAEVAATPLATLPFGTSVWITLRAE